ncbi:MAG: C1 family peptidase [Candidatus Omnitrophota bacterium]
MTLKKSLLGLLIAAVLVSFMMLPSLQGLRDRSDDQIKFSGEDTMKDLQVKIQKMREEIRRSGDTFDVDINPAMQYPLEQLCGLKEDLSIPGEAPVMEANADVMALPTNYTGYYTSVKNQGSCGSCWDFSTTGTVEGAVKKAGGGDQNYSEQYVLDCNTSGYSCSGGWFAFNMFKSPYGARLESCYPYTAVKGTCKSTCGSVKQISAYAEVCGSAVCSTSSIQTAVYNYGIVSVAVYCDSYMQAYTSGCFSRTASGSVNHAVCIVGWNATTPCSTGGWYVKNSWGTSWGQSGFIWIKYGCQQIGYRTTYCY